MRDARLVFSTGSGRICPKCSQPVGACSCERKKPAKAADGTIRIRREVKGRGGKTVTVVSGFQLGELELQALAAELKRRCGTGGSVKEGEVLIQGDHRGTLLTLLGQKGFKVKPAGG
ncbi:MAG: translation initiation factor Sui1 [Desulfobacterales bacterium]|nr:translation initiation factor Sui1 [Desulfobacterales bacterium]